MVTTITMRNVRLRNGIFEFRMRVPKDCQNEIGQREITESLSTADPAQAKVSAEKLREKWQGKFKNIRESRPPSVEMGKPAAVDPVEAFREMLYEHIAKKLVPSFFELSDEELIDISHYCEQSIYVISVGERIHMELEQALGIHWPLREENPPGLIRRKKPVIIEALAYVQRLIDAEIGRVVSQGLDEEGNVDPDVWHPALVTSGSDGKVSSANPEADAGIRSVMDLMFKAKGTNEKLKSRIEMDIGCMIEWCGGKEDITQYSKADLVDYIHNCLPYIPVRMSQNELFEGKRLQECVEMVKNNPEVYEPISYKTCENRYVASKSVFTYAKDQLGLITVNPASGIKIPVVRSVATDDRAFSERELSIIWEQLILDAKAVVHKYPERYWSAVLSLYHGFRQNEVCSLKLKDLQVDADSNPVIRIQAELGVKGRTTKTASSNRVVPIHPYVLNDLGFCEYIERRRSETVPDDFLFPNVTYIDGGNYGRKVSRWFNTEKRELLPADVQHKNFHSLRHTFIRQAQNQAKMSDRCNQEITGHAVQGISNVHLGYSGRLKPKDVLEELEKVRYGWE